MLAEDSQKQWFSCFSLFYVILNLLFWGFGCQLDYVNNWKHLFRFWELIMGIWFCFLPMQMHESHQSYALNCCDTSQVSHRGLPGIFAFDWIHKNQIYRACDLSNSSRGKKHISCVLCDIIKYYSPFCLNTFKMRHYLDLK